MKKHFDDKASTGLIGVILIVFVILVVGAYGTVMLQKADNGYTVANNTTLGETAETNNELMAGIMGAWPILAIIGFLLLVVLALAMFGGLPGGR